METKNPNYYIGYVLEVVDPDTYEVKVSIPGVSSGAPGFPKRGELDEPKPGDKLLLMCPDPIFNSFYLYTKLKEDNFIGYRSRGKMTIITKDIWKTGIYDPEQEYKDSDIPELSSWISIDSEGNIEIMAEGGKDVLISGDSNVTIEGSSSVTISGDCTIDVSGNATINSPNVKVTGGNLEVNGTASPTGSGAFCGIPVCPFSGAPHVGNIISGT